MENRQHWLLNWHSTQNLQLGCDIEKKISGSIIWCWRTHDFIRVESNFLKGAILHSPRNFWEGWNSLRICEAYLENWCIHIILAFLMITNKKQGLIRNFNPWVPNIWTLIFLWVHFGFLQLLFKNPWVLRNPRNPRRLRPCQNIHVEFWSDLYSISIYDPFPSPLRRHFPFKNSLEFEKFAEKKSVSPQHYFEFAALFPALLEQKKGGKFKIMLGSNWFETRFYCATIFT